MRGVSNNLFHIIIIAMKLKICLYFLKHFIIKLFCVC